MADHLKDLSRRLFWEETSPIVPGEHCSWPEHDVVSDINAQCAFWVVRWPSSQMAIAIKTLSHGKTIVLRLFFLYCFRKKTLKLVLLFIFRH